MLVLGKFPDPLGKERHIHKFGVQDPETTKLLGAAKRPPLDKVVFLLGPSSFPKELRPGCVQFGVNTVGQQEHAHSK